MKKHTKIFAAALAVTAAVSGICAFGKNLAKQVDIYYRDIKININGSEYTPKNVDDEVVEPFIYDGTVYLPMRAVANAFDKDVQWNDETNTVIITDKKQDGNDKQSTSLDLSNSNAQYNTSIEKRIEKDIEKSELDSVYLFTVNGVPFTEASLKYAVTASTAYYGGKSDSDSEKAVFDEINNFFRLNAAVVSYANEHGITLSDEEYNVTVTENAEQMKGYFGDDFYSVIEQYTAQTPHFYFLNQCYNKLYSKLPDEFSKDSLFAAVVKEKVLAAMTTEEKPYVRAKHILVCFPEDENGNVSDADKQNTLKKANEVYELVKNGGDFDALVKQYGEDPGMSTYPHGYYFTYGEMVEPFEKAAFALKEGEYSQPVETFYGYHIILRLPLDDDEALKTTDIYSAEAYKLIDEQLSGNSKNYEIVYADNYSEKYSQYRKTALEQYSAN